MADGTGIEWTDATWNIVTGCSQVSAGCTNCYAQRLAGTRLKDHPSRALLTRETERGPVWTGMVRFNPQWLDQPLRWRRPRRVFVCAHGDLFHEKVPDEWLDQVFSVMAGARQHTFQVLTKRPERARAYMERVAAAQPHDPVHQAVFDLADVLAEAPFAWPLPNVWLGVSVEDQATAVDRVHQLVSTPAAVRWVSYEPALGAVDFTKLGRGPVWWNALDGSIYGLNDDGTRSYHLRKTGGAKLDWIVAGGESGPGARPADARWFRDVRDACVVHGVQFLFKQWGDWAPALSGTWYHPLAAGPQFLVRAGGADCHDFGDGFGAVHVGKKVAGRHLDGRTWDQYPGAPR